MAILGMQPDMQRNSHFPGRYSAWDLNLDANGTVWSADNVNRIFRNTQSYNGSLPTSPGLSVFNKDLLKQTMLKHEAQFRDQIHELHRLYRRQKELIEEMKKIDLQKHHLSLETLQPSHILSPKSSYCVQMPQFTSTSINRMHSHSPVSEAKRGILSLHSSDGKAGLACNGLTCSESTSKAPEFVESNCKMVGKKILDLELPAVFYIDSDEEGSSEVKLAPKASEKLTTAFKKLPDHGDGVDKKLSNCGSGCNSIFSEGNFIPSNSLKTKVLTDLNIPIKLEEDIIPELGDSLGPVIGCKGASLQDLSEKSNSKFQFLSKEVYPNSQIVRNREADLDIILQNKHKMQSECIPIYEKAGRSRNGLNSFSQCDHAENLSSPKFCSSTLHGASWRNDFQQKGQPPSKKSISLNCNGKIDPAFEHHSPVKCTKSFDLNSVLPNLSGCSPEIAETPLNEKSGERRDKPIPLEDVLKQANFLGVHNAAELKVVACNSLDFKTTIGIQNNISSIPSGQYSSHTSPPRNPSKSSANKDVKYKEKETILDKQLEFHHLADSEKQLATAKLVAESEPCKNYPGYEVLIDLNTCLSVDESQLIPSQSIEIGLEPPVSPENKESSPPRGESNENQLETPLLSSGQEDVDMQEAIFMNAAEALVSMSSSEIHTLLESTNYKPFKASKNNPLYWFARVASSVVDDPGSEFGVKVEVKDDGDHEEYLSDGIDYFEAMTLNLADVKVEEAWCRGNGQQEEAQTANFSRNQTKRGRTRGGRQQRKDFLSEILPSLASLSRYEVTEDLQTIGGLMEAAGARWESGPRIAGRNGCAKGRRRSNPRASSTMESSMNTLCKQQSVDNEEGTEQRRPIEWGKITRRPRQPRCPSSNRRLILGQV